MKQLTKREIFENQVFLGSRIGCSDQGSRRGKPSESRAFATRASHVQPPDRFSFFTKIGSGQHGPEEGREGAHLEAEEALLERVGVCFAEHRRRSMDAPSLDLLEGDVGPATCRPPGRSAGGRARTGPRGGRLVPPSWSGPSPWVLRPPARGRRHAPRDAGEGRPATRRTAEAAGASRRTPRAAAWDRRCPGPGRARLRAWPRPVRADRGVEPPPAAAGGPGGWPPSSGRLDTAPGDRCPRPGGRAPIRGRASAGTTISGPCWSRRRPPGRSARAGRAALSRSAPARVSRAPNVSITRSRAS